MASEVPPRYATNAALLGLDVLQRVRSVKVLVVGAGGIGCELLKTLVLTGFEHIDVIDLDTIDASNLNRQFLFQKGDVGKSKAEVAQRAATAFNPLATIAAHHGNIKDPRYGDTFFDGFDLVINALDNLDARKHVNRMCVKKGLPLVESGTRGFEGQAQPIVKGTFECFECRPKHEARKYAYCTIRAAPTRMVHCVAFAKVLYEHLFGVPEDDDDPVQFADVRAASEAAGESKEELAARLFNKMHGTAIEELLALRDHVWTTPRPTPAPPFSTFAAAPTAVPAATGHQAVLGGPEQARAFADGFLALLDRPRQSFDKDDDDATRFVCAVSNLRALVYGVPMQSFFDVKAIAGNIVPAVATTNAIISGTVVLEALKILAGRTQDCRMTYCHPVPKRFSRKPCVLYPSEVLPPNPRCYVCSDRKKQAQVLVDTTTTPLGFFVKAVLQGHFAFAEPLLDGDHGGVYDHEVHQGHPKLVKTLAENRIEHGSRLVATDTLQDIEVELTIVHIALTDPAEFQVLGDDAAANAAAAAAARATVGAAAAGSEATSSNAVDEDNSDEVLEYVPKTVRRAGEKRKATDGAEAEGSQGKRARPAEADSAICLD